MAHMIHCRWTSQSAKVVLEVQSENSKACSDAEPCAIGDLLREMEEEGITDVSFMATHVPVPRLTASKV